MIIVLSICLFFGLVEIGACIKSGLREIASAIRCYPHVANNIKNKNQEG